MPTARWKQIERDVARLLGGERIGADGLTYGVPYPAGCPDVEAVTDAGAALVIEVKHGRQVPLFCRNALGQAAKHRRRGCTSAEPDRVPCAVFHPDGVAVRESLVLIRLADFAELVRAVSGTSDTGPAGATNHAGVEPEGACPATDGLRDV